MKKRKLQDTFTNQEENKQKLKKSFKKLPRSFYQNTDVLAVSKALLGKIVETEAYRGIDDKASHAYGNLRSPRTESMYLDGGNTYVYLCYGMHALLNIVTGPKDIPHAVLIRAIEPTDGITTMLERRKMQLKYKKNSTIHLPYSAKLTAGPGILTKALGITTSHDRIDMCSKKGKKSNIWIEDRDDNSKPYPLQIITGPRVGVGYAKEDAKLPWRFKIKDNPWVSKAK